MKNIGKTLSQTLISWSLGAATLIASMSVPAFGQEIYKVDVGFAFQVAGETLPAGMYEFRVDRMLGTVTTIGPKGSDDALEPWVTTMAARPNLRESDIVFDKVGNKYYLSELWEPGKDGVLVQATKEKHTHQILHAKKK